MWENEYFKWLEKRAERDPSFSREQARVNEMPRSRPLGKKNAGKYYPNADTYARYFEHNLAKQRRKQAIMIVQKIARGWMTRVTIKRLIRKAKINLKQTWPRLMQEYKDLVGRLRERYDLSFSDYIITLSNIEDYINRKQMYDTAFNKVTNGSDKMSLENMKSFFWNCRLYPTNREIQMAIKKVSQSSKNRSDLMLLLENSNRLPEKNLLDSKELSEILVSAIDLSRYRNRIGVVTFTGSVNVHCSLEGTRDTNQILEDIASLKPEDGHPQISQALTSVQNMMQTNSRPWCQRVCILVTGGRGLNREDVQEESRRVRQKGTGIFVIGIGDHVKTEESQSLVSSHDHDFRLSTYESVQELMNDFLLRLFPNKPDGVEFNVTELFSKADVLEVLWTIYPPKGAGLSGVKKSRWIRPVIDGEEAWSLLDDEILKKTDLKSCLRLVVSSTLERDGYISIPSEGPFGVTKVTDVESALVLMENYIREKRRQSRQRLRAFLKDVE